MRQRSFQDARNTFHDPILLGPPSLEFAPYAKTPGSRSRKDARQGTIDQDVDFIAFLESLTQPVARPAGVDAPTDAEEKRKKETVMTTPLVQFIKDKKASKSKDGSGSKSKHSRAVKAVKESKQEKVQAKKLLQRGDKDSTTSSDKKVKGEKPSSKESAKTAKASTSANAKAVKPKAPSNPIKEPSIAPERKRERGNTAVATKILQRDLGLSTPSGRRRGKVTMGDAAPSKDVASGESAVPSAVAPKKDPKPAKNTSTTSNTTRAKDGEPSSLTETASVPVKPPTKTSKGGKSKVLSTAKQAFLKHANPSQGVTEALLETAFSPFGAVTRVEIDKKKGFGYVDFAGPEGLRKAIAASPVSVAQSQVVVLERKENPGSDKSRKGRDTVSASKVKGAAEAPVGTGTGTGGATSTGGTPGSSSRGSRGGRGSRNKGPKGAAASEKTAEAK